MLKTDVKYSYLAAEKVVDSDGNEEYIIGHIYELPFFSGYLSILEKDIDKVINLLHLVKQKKAISTKESKLYKLKKKTDSMVHEFNTLQSK